MIVARSDHAYFHSEASFTTFRKDNVLFLVLRCSSDIEKT